MRIALLSYRSKPHGGGQGVYVRYLSRALAELGHTVEVFSGQPYPELDPGVILTKVPSLDLYNDADPFRTPRPSEVRDLIDVREVLTMWTAGFPEPRTFSARIARILRARVDDFDVVHDNQCLGYGLLDIEKSGLPLVVTIHHPITRDRELAMKQATGWRKISTWRWHGFLTMQAKVARKLKHIVTVSQSSADHIAEDFGVAPERIAAIPLGVDTELFAPHGIERVPGSLVCIASADQPLKGVPVLLEALAKLRSDDVDASLTLISKLTKGGPADKLLDSLGLRGAVRVVSGVDDSELALLVSSAEIAVVPSLYEGFCLPAIEAMSCGTPLIASQAGALPEVVGTDNSAALLVEPGNADALAGALKKLLADPAERQRLAAGGRQRVLDRFSWVAVATATTNVYQQAIAENGGENALDSSRIGVTGAANLETKTTMEDSAC